MSRPLVVCVILVVGVVVLSGCTSRDPYYRTDVWQPTGANAANIAAMVADPHDLIRGRGVNRTLAKEPAQAVEKVWTLTDAGGGGGGGSGGPGGGSGSGGTSGGLGGGAGAPPPGG